MDDLKNFGKTMNQTADDLEGNVELLIKRAALVVHKQLMEPKSRGGTPVGTPETARKRNYKGGTLKSNWFVAIGSAPKASARLRISDDDGAVASAVNAFNVPVIDTFKLGKGSVFIFNNTQYGLYPNDGTVSQRPQMFVERAAKKGEDLFESSVPPDVFAKTKFIKHNRPIKKP